MFFIYVFHRRLSDYPAFPIRKCRRATNMLHSQMVGCFANPEFCTYRIFCTYRAFCHPNIFTHVGAFSISPSTTHVQQYAPIIFMIVS